MRLIAMAGCAALSLLGFSPGETKAEHRHGRGGVYVDVQVAGYGGGGSYHVGGGYSSGRGGGYYVGGGYSSGPVICAPPPPVYRPVYVPPPVYCPPPPVYCPPPVRYCPPPVYRAPVYYGRPVYHGGYRGGHRHCD